MTPTSKSPKQGHDYRRIEMPGIKYIFAFLIGILIFLLFGGSLFGIKPELIWIAGLMGISVAAIVFWVWSEILKKRTMTTMSETKPQEFKTACGGNIKDPSQYPSAEYGGERVYFCTNACLRTFELTPDQFVAGEVEHPLDDD